MDLVERYVALSEAVENWHLPTHDDVLGTIASVGFDFRTDAPVHHSNRPVRRRPTDSTR